MRERQAKVKFLFTVIVGPTLAVLTGIQSWHYAKFGALVSYGVHVDVVRQENNEGTVYVATLVNLSADTLEIETIVPSEKIRNVEILVGCDVRVYGSARGFYFDPRDISHNPMLIHRLTPGSSLVVGRWDLADEEVFDRGDWVQAVVRRRLERVSESEEGEYFYSPPFQIR